MGADLLAGARPAALWDAVAAAASDVVGTWPMLAAALVAAAVCCAGVVRLVRARRAA